MALDLLLCLVLDYSARHRYRNLLLVTLQGDFLPDLLTIYSLNLLASRRVLISPIDTFIVSILTQIERRVTSNT